MMSKIYVNVKTNLTTHLIIETGQQGGPFGPTICLNAAKGVHIKCAMQCAILDSDSCVVNYFLLHLSCTFTGLLDVSRNQLLNDAEGFCSSPNMYNCNDEEYVFSQLITLPFCLQKALLRAHSPPYPWLCSTPLHSPLLAQQPLLHKQALHLCFLSLPQVQVQVLAPIW